MNQPVFHGSCQGLNVAPAQLIQDFVHQPLQGIRQWWDGMVDLISRLFGFLIMAQVMLTYLCGEVIIWVLFWFTGCLVKYSHLTSTVQCSIRIFTAFPLISKDLGRSFRQELSCFYHPCFCCSFAPMLFRSHSSHLTRASTWFGSVGDMLSVPWSCGGISRQHSQNWIQQRPKCEKNGDPHSSSSLKTNNLELKGLFCYFCSKEDWWGIQLRNAFLGWGQVPYVVSPTLVSLMGICRLWLCWAIIWFGYAVMELRTNTKFRSRHIQLTTHWRKGGSWRCCQVRWWHIPPPNNSRTWISRLGSLGKNIMIPIGDAQASWVACKYSIGSGSFFRPVGWSFMPGGFPYAKCLRRT